MITVYLSSPLFVIQDTLSHGVSKGILTPLFAATSPTAESLNGKVSLYRYVILPFMI